MDSVAIFLYTRPMIKIILSLTLLTSSLSFAKEYQYNELMTKDYDDMQSTVHKGIKAAKKIALEKQKEGDEDGGDQAAVAILRDTTQFVLSRPDKDFMVAKLMPLLRKELTNYGAFEDSLTAISTQAIMNLKSDKAPTSTKSTAVFILENLMSEIQPELDSKPEFKKIVEEIRDAKIEVPRAVRTDRKLTSMFKTSSPSETAKELLKKVAAIEAKATKDAKKAKSEKKSSKKLEDKDE